MDAATWVTAIVGALGVGGTVGGYFLALRNKKQETAYVRKLDVYAGIAERLYRLQGEFFGALIGHGLPKMSCIGEMYRDRIEPLLRDFRTYFEVNSLFISQEAFDALGEINRFFVADFEPIYEKTIDGTIERYNTLRVALQEAANLDLRRRRVSVAFPRFGVPKSKRTVE